MFLSRRLVDVGCDVVDITKPISRCDNLLVPDTENTIENSRSVSRPTGRSESTAVYGALSLEDNVFSGAKVRMQTVLRMASRHAHLRGVLD